MRALSLLFALAFALLTIAGCQHPQEVPTDLLRAHAAASCDLDIRDGTCIACMKRNCCAEMVACGTMEHCPCAIPCARAGNKRACAAACPGADDRAVALCAADRCFDFCGGAK